MELEIKYINLFDDINTSNIESIQEVYRKADIRIENRFGSPSFEETKLIKQYIDNMGEFNEENIANHLKQYTKVSDKVARAIANNMSNELSLIIPSQQAIYSSYGKIAYWIKTLFSGVINETENYVYVSGELTKHELYTVYIVSKLSNNVVIVDTKYEKEKYNKYNNIIHNITNTTERLKITSRPKPELRVEDVIHLLSNIKTGYNIVVIGESSIINEALVILDKGLTTQSDTSLSNRITLFKDGIGKPTFEETHSIPRITAESISKLISLIGIHMFKGDRNTRELACNFIKKELAAETNVSKAINRLIAFIHMNNKYSIKELVVYYGEVNKMAATYLKFITTLGATVIIIDTMGKIKEVIDNYDSWSEVIVGEKVEYHKFPTSIISNTLAYKASREIDNMLYSGTQLGLYRDRQYKKCDIVTMHSTFDEINLLWGQDNTFKPSFISNESTVTIPVFYAKISGTTHDYEKTLSKLVTEHTLVCYNHNSLFSNTVYTMQIRHLVNINNTTFKEQRVLYKNNKLNIDEIMSCKEFAYRHLEKELQYNILYKIEMILNGNWIEHPEIKEEQFIDMVLNIGLNLEKRIQQEMQWYDYTKQSPKLLVLCQDESILKIEHSIIITLLHLCGWDIVIAVPTCYNILGSNIKCDEIQNHTIGEPRFDINITSLKPMIADKKKTKWFNKLFNGEGN